MARAPRQIRLAGVFAAIITPRREGTLEADFSAALDLLDFAAEAGAAGVCILDRPVSSSTLASRTGNGSSIWL
jgi:hypothetical protein